MRSEGRVWSRVGGGRRYEGEGSARMKEGRREEVGEE